MPDPYAAEGFREMRNPIDVDQCKAFSYMSSVEFDLKAIEWLPPIVYDEPFDAVFRNELVPLMTVFENIKVVDYVRLANMSIYSFAYRRFGRTKLALEFKDTIHACDYQELYMTIVLTDDNHCLRLSRISRDWCIGFFCWWLKHVEMHEWTVVARLVWTVTT